ncbi:OLC1v1011424C1 [Oldenlandia corymbosa var. corymbosa]|uniref:OLC1v1011424C1 n=1 Tax=Oldenlandia corymbosa var. corymbosa TaxID=529605 RepID=A0AAV1DTM7_OLDCO|nr:OLC1v1011424C1 [Oldenlandia corymbosa var. corymbosa]
MSWLARSIANTLKFDDEDADDNQSNDGAPNPNEDRTRSNISPETEQQLNDDPTASPRGVKDDLSELTKTLSRQFWGVASFLAPPPQSEPYKPLEESESTKPDLDPNSGSEDDPAGIMGIRNDFAEIGGKFRTGISMISNNIAVSEITKMASNLLQLGSDEEEDAVEGDSSRKGVIGVTDEVVSFARDIATHPETWLDFPLPDNADDDDFEMSDAQQEHALAVEHLAPGLAALRIELCPGYMSESCFWKIYFVLLHPRLDKEDAVLLSTPQWIFKLLSCSVMTFIPLLWHFIWRMQIMNARALLSQELQNRSKAKVLAGEGTIDAKDSSYSQNEETLSVPSSTDHDSVPVTSVVETSASTAAEEYGTEEQPFRSIEVQNSNKPVALKTDDQNKGQNMQTHSTEENDEDDADDWLKEESTEVGGIAGSTIPIENEEDVSFSDLEEDDEDVPTSLKKPSYSSDKDSRDWVQL